MNKECRTCKVDKPISDYYPDTTMKDGYYNICKECTLKRQKNRYKEKRTEILEAQRIWRKGNEKERERTRRFRIEHPELYRKYHARHRLRVRYGLTLEDYERMFDAQNGLCAICSQPETVRNGTGQIKMLSLDHCHATNTVRSLLCDNCNKGLGVFHDDVNVLRRAIEYLESHGQLLQTL